MTIRDESSSSSRLPVDAARLLKEEAERLCICADPENCTEPVPGRICQRHASPITQLGALLKEAGATVQIGLRAQGHFDTVTRMVLAGEAWTAIGKAIGWHGPTVADWYAREAAAALTLSEQARVVAEQRVKELEEAIGTIECPACESGAVWDGESEHNCEECKGTGKVSRIG